MPQRLDELLQDCTVKITVPGGWGTGFFVAPGLILTCDHVVKALEGDARAQIDWQQRSFTEAAVVERRPEVDLALLQCSPPPDVEMPCVYLGEAFQPRDDLYTYGYPDSFPQGTSVTGVCEGSATENGSELLVFKLAQVRPGLSGAPLLNWRTGRVCGMVKFTRDRSIDLGGGVIPTRVILEQFLQLRELQQEFHEGDRRWVNLITTQSGIDFQPYLQAILGKEDYREWQKVYTPTTVEDRRRMPLQDTEIASQRQFSSRLKLRVETVKPDKAEQGNQPDGAQEPQERVEQWDVLAGLRNYAAEHVVLIGKPGSGKSTSLERLLWEEAEKALQDPNARIPVLVKLRRCTGTIDGLIRDFLLSHQVVLEIAQIEALLRQGRFLLLLDGLNEFPKAFETEVANFRDRYRRTTPMIVSTRDLGGGGTLGIEKTLKMLPLTEPQMREFVRGYLGVEGDLLFQQLQDDRLGKFAETPLLLWMLCRVFAQNGKVPDNLGLAFREFAQLHDQELQADAPAESKDQWHKLLRHLAFVMMQGKTAIDPELSIPREEAEDCLTAYLRQEDRANPRECAERWLKDLLKYHLIQPVIQPNFEEHIEFRHQLIQEYYAAEYLLRLLPTLTDDQLKQDYLNYLKWTEPISLMLALEDKEAQALRVVKLALDEVDLMLGARLTGEVKPIWQVKTVDWLDKRELLIPLKCRCWSVSRSEYAIARLLQVLQHEDREVRQSAARALGESGSGRAIPALLQALQHKDREVRWSAVGALRHVISEQAIPVLLRALQDEDKGVRRNAVDVLGHLSSEQAIPALLQALQDEDKGVRRSAVRALSDLDGEKAIHALPQVLQHEDREVRQSTVDGLGHLSSEQAIPALLQALQDEDKNIRWRAARALGELGSEQAIPALLQTLQDEDKNIRWRAARALGELGSEQTIPALLQALKHEEREVRRRAVLALKKLGNPQPLAGTVATGINLI
jgi:HEAT repeat protein